MTEKIKKSYFAYILSRENGTVQIGDTVYQPCTGKSFAVNTNPKGICFEIWEKNMAAAEAVLSEDAKLCMKGIM